MIRLDCSPILKVPGRDDVVHLFIRTLTLGGDSWAHLIPGRDGAILFDTGFGVGNIRGLCEEVTDLPITVVNSHFHFDHTGGNPQFERAYIHKYDADILKKELEDRLAAGKRTAVPAGEVFFFDDEDVIQPREYEIIPIEDGDVFDLGGGYEFEVFHLPGHSPGGIALLDRRRGFLFSGDTVLGTPTSMAGKPKTDTGRNEFLTVEAFHKGLQRLAEHINEFSIIYSGHNHLGQSSQLVLDMLACTEELLSGDTTAHAYANAGNYHNVPIHIHGQAKIYFSTDRIFAN